MSLFSKITYFFILIFLMITPLFSQQSYDKTNCTAIEQVPGSNYLCNSQKTDCDTFIVYRAQENYKTLSSIASLFDTTVQILLSFNNISGESTNILNKEILVPIVCTCPDRFSYSRVSFDASKTNSSYDVACGIFEGLVKEQILLDQNPGLNVNISKKKSIQVPIRCACPEVSDTENSTKFLVTYPVMENEYPNLISRKFGVPVDLIISANRLNAFETIYPHTTLLIPTNTTPIIRSLSEATAAPSPRFVVFDISPGQKPHRRILKYVGWGFLVVLILMILPCVYFIFIRKRNNPSNFKPLFEKGLRYSPQLRDRMSKLKHSLVIFTPEEISIATSYFCEANVIGAAVYKAEINSTYLAIEQMSTEQGARHVIDILTKINHLNVVKLVGCCYGPTPFLAYEYAEYGSLRDCLSNAKIAKQLNWKTRVQIAFDLAVGLHYIHHCTKPAYVHRNINSRNVLITLGLRAKISGFRLAKALMWTEEKEGLNWNESLIVGRKGYLAPEYLTEGQASTKIDVYAFGVVLLELLSANEVKKDGKIFKHSISFLDGEALTDSNGCLEKFSEFMDPALEGDYPVGDAMCLALLAMGCLEDEPIQRPSMNDALKALSRFI